MDTLRTVLVYYFAVISVAAVILTIYDKNAAWNRARRVSERTLLIIGFFGGALFEYIVMLIIRHKTRHTNFMLALPFFVIMHLVLAWYIYIYTVGV